MAPRFYIKKVTFNDGTILECDKDDIIVFVGANNAGKSASLKEISSKFRSKRILTKVVTDIDIAKEGDQISFKSFFENNSILKQESGNSSYLGFGYNIYANSIDRYLSNYLNGIEELFSFYANVLNTEQRLIAANPPTSIRLTNQPMQHPIHYLQKNDNLEKSFSNYFRQAFGKDLIVHRNAGSEVPLYVGEKPIPKQGEDRVSENYIIELEKLDLLHQQGDGMRSFVGVLLNSFTSNHNLLFIDEPEAFLHPPQAKLLGKMLSKNLPSEKQLFLATHSEDFLKGLLEGNPTNIKIVRISRNEDINNISILDGTEINSIWNDSLLRHSNILSGLFHSKVVICESDSDSRFYSSVLNSLYDDSSLNMPDVLFINVGGKHRISVAIKALNKLNVPIKVIADFDVLNNIEPLKTIYEDLGGVWNEVSTDWQLVKSEIESKRPEFLTTDVKTEMNNILESVSDRIFPKNKVNEIQKVLKKASAWTEAKEVGKAFIPNGNATQSFDKIQLKFIEKGLLIPEVGELESFVKSIGNHGPKWINQVLIKDLKNDPELLMARTFVGLI
ncbi:ATP-dependent nuclease [Elizabethkingia meningoseptica]|uniref:ATP-dependent nuclease n=1 Tax=Elizabethkingia meningoseptica TaxID=238 RepID=UPI001365BEB6|nr:AAA family ATPase [Elizabethkingia meningoseptica]MDE5488692.1 ATP-binding protein [Elizabethkingia meningoseptica]MVW93527.1 ATP-binding protein [Elizabethkingia meningoseptica]